MLACDPSGSSTLALSDTLAAGLGKNLPQSTNGTKVITVPAAAISFRKSRRDTLPPRFGGVWCVIIKRQGYKISINLVLLYYASSLSTAFFEGVTQYINLKLYYQRLSTFKYSIRAIMNYFDKRILAIPF